MSNMISKVFYRNAIKLATSNGKIANFVLDEFSCECCSTVMFDKRLLDLLQQIRDNMGKPMRITSGYRCPAHNAEVGGVPNSHHTQGLAADVAIKDMTSEELAEEVEKTGAKRIGVYKDKGFVHVSVEDAYRNNVKLPKRFYK